MPFLQWKVLYVNPQKPRRGLNGTVVVQKTGHTVLALILFFKATSAYTRLISSQAHPIPTHRTSMRSPLIAFSLVAAAVSPSLAAAHSNSPKFGRSVAHPHVAEVDNASPGALRFKRSGVNGLGLNKLTGSGNPLDELLPQGAPVPSPPNPNSDAGTHKDSGSEDPFASAGLPVDPTANNPTSAVPAGVPNPGTVPSSELGNVPAPPIEPATPANPYGNGQQGATSNNDMVSSEHVPNSKCPAPVAELHL